MRKPPLNSEYQRRLDAWARRLVAERQPDWEPPADAAAVWKHSPAWTCGYNTCQGDESMMLMLANRYVAEFTLADLPGILQGILETVPQPGLTTPPNGATMDP